MPFFKKNNRDTLLTKVPEAPATRFPYYNIEHLEQGSEVWRSWRKGVIGASDAPTIMNENPWQSVQHLINEKMGLTPEFTGNAATREGNRLEEFARESLIKKYKIDLSPTVIQDGKVPYFAASLDAIDKSHSLVFEIKCGLKAYQSVVANGVVPNYYYGQLQHILMITQLDQVIYAAYRPDARLITIEINRDENYILKMRSAEEKFANTLQKKGKSLQKDFKGKVINRK